MVVFLTKSSTSFGKSDGEKAGVKDSPAFGIIPIRTPETFNGVGGDDDVFGFHDT